MYNKAFMVGQICSPVNTKTIDSGKLVGSFRLLTEDPGKQYHSINCYEKTAELASSLAEGTMVFVEGRVVTRSYQDNAGVKKYITTINAARLGGITAPSEAGEGDQDDF